MTERDDGPEEAPASPEAERQVSELLADAAVTEPMPAHVAARLDDVLAGLVAERGHGSPSGTAAPGPGDGVASDAVVGATELASRRPRLWPRLLVAAAAVSVIGLGIGNLDNLTGTGAGEASTADSAAGGALEEPADADASLLSEAAPEAAQQPQAPSDKTAPGEREDAADDPSEERIQADPYPSLATGPRLRTTSATLDLQRIEDFSLAVPVGDSPAAWSVLCVHPATDAGDEWLPVHLDGEPGVLVLRAPAGGRRTAEVFTCGDATSPALATEVRAAR